MKMERFVNDQTLNMKLSDVIKTYDTDANGFTEKEFSTAVKGMTSVFAKNIIKIFHFDKSIFKDLDTNKDKMISYNEFAKYMDKEYKLDFYSLMNLTIKDICRKMDNADKK